MARPLSRGKKLTTADMIARLQAGRELTPDIRVATLTSGPKALAARAAAALVRRTPLRTRAEGFLNRPIAPPRARLALPPAGGVAKAVAGTGIAVVGASAAERGFDILKRNAPAAFSGLRDRLVGGVVVPTAAELAESLARNIRVPKITRPSRPSGGEMGAHGAGQSISTLPGVGGSLPPRDTVVKVWDTGTAKFARLADGRIAVQKKDGTIKTYRPQKHIVIPRNPRVGTLIRADKRLKRLVKGLKKVVK